MIGRTVIYRTDGRNGLVYDLPAIITVTDLSHPGDYPDGRSNPLPVPDEGHVHLTVLTPGGFGTQVYKEDVMGSIPILSPESDDFPNSVMTPGSGTYVEWNVPYAGAGDPKPRTWRWPDDMSDDYDHCEDACRNIYRQYGTHEPNCRGAEVAHLHQQLATAESVIRDLDVSIAHPDMGGQHQAKTGTRPRLTSEQWQAVAKAVNPHGMFPAP